MVSISASHPVGCWFAPQSCHTKGHHKRVKTASLLGTHVLGYEFNSAARLSKWQGSMWNCLWGHGLKRSPGINCKSRLLYLAPGFLSSAV